MARAFPSMAPSVQPPDGRQQAALARSPPEGSTSAWGTLSSFQPSHCSQYGRLSSCELAHPQQPL
eukprot:7442588-Alexandrium_andersonii.AAC.1